MTQKIEVVLSRDLPLGRDGAIKKADSTVQLDAVQARELLMIGHARLPEKAATIQEATVQEGKK
jgi:hypothetical protein